ncbi:hypothetical protein AN477_09595 [Alicyclobacillus ferrooxydans]|uniref:Uncharacterized protein n=1 Tax=Alicyclobacillus ferrooxydans TaxID=471514 RepID=A0A0P9GSF2_9BACL|nr:hypothetical protein AN477_09595 [Alicyclobacillus ferrooxydans]
MRVGLILSGNSSLIMTGQKCTRPQSLEVLIGNDSPVVLTIQKSKQVATALHSGEKLAIYDFTYEQYFSWVHSPRILIRKERGKINNFDVSHLTDTGSRAADRIQKQDAARSGKTVLLSKQPWALN